MTGLPSRSPVMFLIVLSAFAFASASAYAHAYSSSVPSASAAAAAAAAAVNTTMPKLVYAKTSYPYTSTSKSIVDCGQGKSLFQITSLSLFPTSVQAGKNISIQLQYSSPVRVDNGTIVVKMTYNFMPLPTSVNLLCASATCPIEPGLHDGSTVQNIPVGLSGSLTSRITWLDTTNTQLLCIQVSVSIIAQKRLFF